MTAGSYVLSTEEKTGFERSCDLPKAGELVSNESLETGPLPAKPGCSWSVENGYDIFPASVPLPAGPSSLRLWDGWGRVHMHTAPSEGVMHVVTPHM